MLTQYKTTFKLSPQNVVILTIIVLVNLLCGCTKTETPRTILRFSANSHPDYDVWRRDLAKDFEKTHPGVKVKYEPVSGTSYWGKILTQIAGRTAPDAIWMRGTMVPQFVRRNSLVDLTPFIEADADISMSEYLPQAVKEYRFKGRIYALPQTICPEVLYYNKQIFDEASMPYPDDSWDWNKYREVVRKLTKRDSNDRVLQYGGCISLNWGNFVTLIMQNGGHVYNEDKSQCIINSPEAVEAAKWFYNLVYLDRVIPGRIDYQSSNAYQMFMNGKIVTLHGARWLTVLFRLKKDLMWGITQQPKGKSRVVRLGGHGWAITSQSRHKQLAYELIRKITGKEGIRFISKVGDAIPPMTALLHEDEFLHPHEFPNEDNTIYLEVIKYAYPDQEVYHPLIPEAEVATFGGMELDKFMMGMQSAEEMLRNVEDKFNKIIVAGKN